MSESPWGIGKEKGKTPPFGTGATAGAVFPENATVTPIGDQSNQNIATVADETISINPVGQQDPKPEIPIIDGIENHNPFQNNSKPAISYDNERGIDEPGKPIALQESETDQTKDNTGLRKRPLPLFEPELPVENEDVKSSFLQYGDNFTPNDGTNGPVQMSGRNPFEAMSDMPINSPLTQTEAIDQKTVSPEKVQNSGIPLFPPATPDMGSMSENEIPQAAENEAEEAIRNENGLLTIIKKTFKRFTHKKKLIDRMEEWQPPEPEEKEEETTPNVVERNMKTTPDNNLPANYDNAETVSLEDIRKVIPIEPQNVESESEQRIPEVQTDQPPSEITTDSGVTEKTASPETSVTDSLPGYSQEEIRTIKEELADSKQGNEELGKDIKELTGTINEMESSIDSMKRDGDSFSSIINMRVDESTKRIECLEERLNEFEVTLESIHTDNVDLKTDLNTIEQNIAELTGSYSIMLKQMQKLTEFGNSRSAEIFETNKRIDRLDQTLSTLNAVQEESQKSMLELRSVTSDLIRSVENTHNANKDFRADRENQDQLIKDELVSLTDFVEKEFKNLGARSYRANGENIQLNNIIKNSTNMKLCMEWLEFLMELVGRNHLADILSYYEELGWISEDVRLELMRYAEGIDYYIEKTDWKLAPDDHVKSIWFIEQLAGLKVDKNRLSIVEKNIKKVKNGTEIYGI
ncbi:FlaD/FlaE family flagellar protein [Methanococcoides sp. LMO-2]|uniref:FlaD/FlaE family flagellar protein n=1 Tax=Methanococcoides cohabitans TaxID=3136559 RepID=A0ABU9KX17_9EURY